MLESLTRMEMSAACPLRVCLPVRLCVFPCVFLCVMPASYACVRAQVIFNQLPVALGVAKGGCVAADGVVNLDGSASTDTDGWVATYSWTQVRLLPASYACV